MNQKGSPTRAVLWLLAAFALLIALGVAFSSYQREMGVSEASEATKISLATVIVARDALATAEDYGEYSGALRVAEVAADRVSFVGVVDTRTHTEVGHALQYLQAAREAWQADLEGQWDPETYGSAIYWHARLDEVDLPSSGEVTLAEATEAFLGGATLRIDAALEAAGE